ncbi:MAG: hypothetical protein ABIR84_07760 [Candidatus Nitrotoga sp.]
MRLQVKLLLVRCRTVKDERSVASPSRALPPRCAVVAVANQNRRSYRLANALETYCVAVPRLDAPVYQQYGASMDAQSLHRIVGTYTERSRPRTARVLKG